jgi:hypothetical protein
MSDETNSEVFPANADESCHGCAYQWRELVVTRSGGGRASGKDGGEVQCRRYPPIAMINKAGFLIARFPTIINFDEGTAISRELVRCGEYKYKG